MHSSISPHRLLTGCKISFEFGTWIFGELLSSKTRSQYDPVGGDTFEQHEVYECTRSDKPIKSQHTIKIKRQMNFWSNRDYHEPSDGINREVENLHRLKSCTSTPKLIGLRIDNQGPGDDLPGGYIAYIVMQKVPGKGLHNYDELTPRDQNRVRIAFIDALWEFRSNHFSHSDPRRENIIWDPETQKWFVWLKSLIECLVTYATVLLLT
ncbi:hypothetical protein BDV25DRAFT_38548 [Aspergillus avenaceus]|uniref:Protein kinase domain-containing protein n=1 Tax=Aspergillus avenaceus TaxID=36643 RepID=A0A5N6U3K4_ASPAV|nr:hypothetical protein BDV25DRAFT_38548 [Aspergillus avenaceus]